MDTVLISTAINEAVQKIKKISIETKDVNIFNQTLSRQTLTGSFYTALTIAAYLARDNPDFNAQNFMKDCGFPDNKVGV